VVLQIRPVFRRLRALEHAYDRAMALEPEWRCVQCRAPLDHLAARRRCSRCSLSYPVVDGITFADRPSIGSDAVSELDGDAACERHRRLLHARWKRRHTEPYAWFRPFNESSRSLERFLPLIAESLAPEQPILDLWNRTGWTGAWLAARFPDHRVFSIWEGDCDVLGHGGFLHWFSSDRRPSNLELLFISPADPLPFATGTFGFVHGLDSLHRYPWQELLAECLRVADPEAILAFPHLHLTNSEPEPFFERGCLQRHGRDWSADLATVLDDDPRQAWVLSEPQAFDRSRSLRLVDDAETTDYNALMLIGPSRWNGVAVAPAALPTRRESAFLFLNPAVRIDEQGCVEIERTALGGTVGHMLDRHDAGFRHVLALQGQPLSSDAARVAKLAAAGMTVGEIQLELGTDTATAGIDELVGHDLAICELVGPAAARLQQHFSTTWPERDATLSAVWDERRWRYDGHPVIVTTAGDEFHLADVEVIVNAIRTLLAERELAPGERVVIVAGQHPEHLLVTWAVWLSGAVIVPVSPNLAAHQLAAALDAAAPRLIFADTAGEEVLGHLGVGVDVVLDPTQPDAPERDVHLGSMLDRHVGGSSVPVVPRRPDDDAAIIFTSGSTGAPKGVRLSQRSLWWTGASMADLAGLRPGERLWSMAAPDTMSGLRNPCVAALRSGVTVVVPTGTDGSGPLGTEDIVRRLGVDVLVAGPAVVSALDQAHGRLSDFGSLRLLLSTGGPLDADVAASFAEAWGIEVRNYYGLTETGGLCIGQRNGDVGGDGHLGREWGAVVRVFGDDGPVGVGDVGHLVVSGPGLFSGYVGGARGVEQMDGWLFTGDRARQHDDGTIELIGRIDSQVKASSGRVVDGSAVAAVLETHPMIETASVRSSTDGSIAATVRLRGELTNELEIELRSAIRKELGDDAVPRHLETF